MISGAIFTLFRDGLWRGVGVQFFGWGLLDALIALGANSVMQKRLADLPEPGAATVIARGKTNLRRILAINAVLDVFYVIGGFWLDRSKGHTNHFYRGTAWGIVIQGTFLFCFDLLHALFFPRSTAG